MFVLSSGGDHLRYKSSEEVDEEPYDERRYSPNVIIRCITNSQGNTHPTTRDGGYEGDDDDHEREEEYEEKEPPAGGSTVTATTVSSSSTTTTMASNPTELMINIIASRSFMNSPIHFADDEEEVANEDDREDYNPIKPTHKYTTASNDDHLRHGGRHQHLPPWYCSSENTPTSFLFEQLEYCSTSIISYVDDDDDDDIVLSGTAAGAEIEDDGDDLDIIQSSLLLMDCPFSPPILSSRNNNNCHQVGDNLPTPKKILLLRDAAGNDIEEENRQFRHHHRHSNSSLFLHQQHYSTVA